MNQYIPIFHIHEGYRANFLIFLLILQDVVKRWTPQQQKLNSQKDTPFLALTGKLYIIYCEHFWENWHCCTVLRTRRLQISWCHRHQAICSSQYDKLRRRSTHLTENVILTKLSPLTALPVQSCSNDNFIKLKTSQFQWTRFHAVYTST